MKPLIVLLIAFGVAFGAGKDLTVKVHNMPEAKVFGYLDCPQAIYIFDASDSSYSPIKVDKSFSDAYFFQNLDREKFDLENKWVYKH